MARKLNVLQPDGKRWCNKCNEAFDESHFREYTRTRDGKKAYQCKGKYLIPKPKQLPKFPRNKLQPDGRIFCGRCREIFDESHFTIIEYHRKDRDKPVIQYCCKKFDQRLSIYNPCRTYDSNWKHDPFNYRKDVKLQREYGITLDDYQRMFDEQKGCCAICGKYHTELTKALFVDHNHITGKVRGLLCTNCNTGIGVLMENEKILLSAIDYLRKHNINIDATTDK